MTKRILAVGKSGRNVTRWQTTTSYKIEKQITTRTTEVNDACEGSHLVGRLVTLATVDISYPDMPEGY